MGTLGRVDKFFTVVFPVFELVFNTIDIYRIQVKSIVQEFSTTIVTVFPEYRRLMKYIETCVIFSQHMGPRKWRRSFTTTLFLILTATKGEMFPKMSM